ncbi:MAG: hypothetical protein ACM3JJ_08235 [Hyphomicrobiales bacterium]
MKSMRSIRSRSFLLPLCLAAAIAVAAGCGDSSTMGKDLQISNVQDSFQFQVTDMKKYSKTFTYTWANSKNAATVNQACSISEGTATLSIHDATGATVYSRNLKDNGTYPTNTGSAGGWTIILSLSKVSGTLNFRVQAGP